MSDNKENKQPINQKVKASSDYKQFPGVVEQNPLYV